MRRSRNMFVKVAVVSTLVAVPIVTAVGSASAAPVASAPVPAAPFVGAPTSDADADAITLGRPNNRWNGGRNYRYDRNRGGGYGRGGFGMPRTGSS